MYRLFFAKTQFVTCSCGIIKISVFSALLGDFMSELSQHNI